MKSPYPTIPLDTHWTCDYFEPEPQLYEFADAEPVPTLAAWSFDKRRATGWAAMLRRRFTLLPADDCLRYLLQVDSAPPGTRIYLNNPQVATYDVGDDDPPFELDVTDFVALGDNLLELRIACDAPRATLPGVLSGVRLVAIPCQ